MDTSPCFADSCASPLGDLWMVVDAEGALLELQFQEGKLGSASRSALEERYAKKGYAMTWDQDRLRDARTAMARYFDGELREFELALNPQGTEFQRSVWAELVKIPYGTTCSYGSLASKLGNPGASRAVGLANGKNPIAIVIPCHRVIGSDGSLTGYAGGLDRKETLLRIEGCLMF